MNFQIQLENLVNFRAQMSFPVEKGFSRFSRKDDVQTGIFDSPVIVLQANWELYTSDRGEIRVY